MTDLTLHHARAGLHSLRQRYRHDPAISERAVIAIGQLDAWEVLDAEGRDRLRPFVERNSTELAARVSQANAKS